MEQDQSNDAISMACSQIDRFEEECNFDESAEGEDNSENGDEVDEDDSFDPETVTSLQYGYDTLSEKVTSNKPKLQVATRSRIEELVKRLHDKSKHEENVSNWNDERASDSDPSHDIDPNDPDVTFESLKDDELDDKKDEDMLEQSDVDEFEEIEAGILERWTSGGIAGNKEQGYTCPVCARVFRHAGAVTKHIRTHTGDRPFKCQFCGKAFTQSNNCIEHERIHTGERPFSCEFCGKAFAQSRQLTSHVRTHTGERPYSCELCDRTFSNGSHLREHRKIHTGEKPHKCDVCGKNFSRPRDVETHKRVHTGEKPYKCEFCGRGFSQSGTLVAHIRHHTGNKQHVCAVCNKSFSQKSHLDKHGKIHTREIDGERIPCEICGEEFLMRRALNRHLKTHVKELTCEKCGTFFTKVGGYKQHITDGCAGVKPYTCGICGIGFPLRYRLIKHMRRAHTGERPCQCDICGKHYTDKKDLYAHKQTHKTTYKHSCFVCHKGFHQVGNMNRHLRGHAIEIFPKEKLLTELKQTSEDGWNVSEQVANNIREAICLMDSSLLANHKSKHQMENDIDSSEMEDEQTNQSQDVYEADLESSELKEYGNVGSPTSQTNCLLDICNESESEKEITQSVNPSIETSQSKLSLYTAAQEVRKEVNQPS